ncbi:MAG: hypothetical protein U0587_12800 [Candidatus Binatia bacterium]
MPVEFVVQTGGAAVSAPESCRQVLYGARRRRNVTGARRTDEHVVVLAYPARWRADQMTARSSSAAGNRRAHLSSTSRELGASQVGLAQEPSQADVVFNDEMRSLDGKAEAFVEAEVRCLRLRVLLLPGGAHAM